MAWASASAKEILEASGSSHNQRTANGHGVPHRSSHVSPGFVGQALRRAALGVVVWCELPEIQCSHMDVKLYSDELAASSCDRGRYRHSYGATLRRDTKDVPAKDADSSCWSSRV
jgi:hypothetical protein